MQPQQDVMQERDGGSEILNEIMNEDLQINSGTNNEDKEDDFYSTIEVIRLHHRCSIAGVSSLYQYFMQNMPRLVDDYNKGIKHPCYKTIRRKVARKIPPIHLDVLHLNLLTKQQESTKNQVI